MPRFDRQAKKRADLAMLSEMLNIANQFGPEKTQREELGAENVREARLRNQGLEMGLPFIGRENEARIGTVEDERGFARQRQPLMVQGLEQEVKGRELDSLFAEQTWPDRVAGVKNQTALAGTQARQAEQMMPFAVQGAAQDVGHKRQMYPLERAGQESQNQYYNQRRQSDAAEQPLKMDFMRLTNEGLIANNQMMSGGPQQPDQGLDEAKLLQMLRQLGLQDADIKMILNRRPQ